MKIKNANKSLGLKVLFPLMYASTLVLTVLRCLQLAKFIDSETGFFTGGTAVNVIFYGIIAVVCLVMVVISFLSHEAKFQELSGLKDKGAAVGAAVFGTGLVYDCLASLVKGLSLLTNITYTSFEPVEKFKNLMSTGTLPYALQGIFAFISAVYIFTLAKSFSKGTSAAHNRKLIALAPIAWAGFKLITRFVKQISYIRVSDLFLELVMLAFMILFFVSLAQVVSGVYCEDSRWRIIALGLSSAMISLCINIPRFIFTFFASEFLNKEYPFNLGDTMFAVFAVFVALAAYASVKEHSSAEDNTQN